MKDSKVKLSPEFIFISIFILRNANYKFFLVVGEERVNKRLRNI